eukprot:5070163-Prymnesium_polylepis.1
MRQTLPADDVWMPFEHPDKRVKHFCKAEAVRRLVRKPSARKRAFETPMRYSHRAVARKSAAATAFLTSWLHACQQPELMESQPDPEPHREFQWHTHEQCLYSILAAQRPRDRRELLFCFGEWRVAAASELQLEQGVLVHSPGCGNPPTAARVRRWLPRSASTRGHCVEVECAQGASPCRLGASGKVALAPPHGGGCACARDSVPADELSDREWARMTLELMRERNERRGARYGQLDRFADALNVE